MSLNTLMRETARIQAHQNLDAIALMFKGPPTNDPPKKDHSAVVTEAGGKQ